MKSLFSLFLIAFLFSQAAFAQAGQATTSESKKAEQALEMGKFSMSLAVKDIQASVDFYQKLGFEMLEGAGGIEQHWVIMINGDTELGLFQGMFPNNTLTFTPKEARTIYQSTQAAGIEAVYSMGMDTNEGPCSFSILDPDGNSILIDQHP